MKKAIVQAPLELKAVFIDKDFKYSWAMEFRASDIERYKKFDKEYFKRIWEQYMGNGVSAILRQSPKNWKSYELYEKKFEKVMTKKVKANEKLLKKGKLLMGKKEWRKGIPLFQSTIKPNDIRTIIVGKNCSVKVFKSSDLTADTFKKLIDKL